MLVQGAIFFFLFPVRAYCRQRGTCSHAFSPPLAPAPPPFCFPPVFLAFLASLVGPGGSQPFQVALSALLQKATYTVLLARPDGPCASDDTARTRTTTSFATCPPLHAVCHSHTLLSLAHPRPNEGFQRLALL